MPQPPTNSTASETALVIGATGGIGGEVTRALMRRGWRVRALNRNPEAAAKAAPSFGGVEWVKGDAMDSASVIRAAESCTLIFHGANPPQYRNWGDLVFPMLNSTIAAAKARGARIFFPGTVYNFGPEAGGFVDERAPQNPPTRKGELRVAMERRLEAAAREGVPVVIVRAGDFFGPFMTPNSWFSNVFAQPGRPVRLMLRPGPAKVGHAWAYLPDVTEAIVQLAERANDFAAFEVFHFGGHWTDEAADIPEAIRHVVGRKIPIISFPWLLARLFSPFNETLREMLEMRYLWERPLRLDNAKLVKTLGAEPHTPLEQAVRETLEGRSAEPIAGREAGGDRGRGAPPKPGHGDRFWVARRSWRCGSATKPEEARYESARISER